MGTQRFRTSTVPAIQRTLRRIAAQRRLPAHIVPNLISGVRRRLRPFGRAVRRISIGWLRARLRAAAGDAVVLTERGWRAATPLIADSAADLGAWHLAAVMDLLATAGADPFVTDRRGPIHHRIGVFEEHRPVALAALRDAGFERAGILGRATPGGRPGRRPSRIVVWRWFHLGNGVASGPGHGVDVEFWRDEVIGRVVPDGRRGLASFFPDPEAGATVTVRGRTLPTHSTFAAELESRTVPFPVDIVYTWVDGSDPVWQASYREHLERAGRLNPEAANVSRYANRDELRYSMRSLWWNADFFRHVYLVTAGHVPAWLDTSHPRLTVVDHRDIFPAGLLPTFNSHAIESRLHHIPGLAEHYLYVNDDVFFGRPVEASTFFSPNGIARMFLSTAPMPPGPATPDDVPVDAAAKNGRRLLEGAFGYVPVRKLRHAPHPQLRSVLAEVEARFPTEVAATTAARFRSVGDISLASSLAQHYGFATGRYVIGDLVTRYVNIANRWAPGQLDDLARRRNCDVLCLNETSMEEAHEHRVDRTVADFLETYLPTPSPFERHSSTEPPPV